MVRLWNLESNNCLMKLSGHTNFIAMVAWAPVGLLLATASDDSTVRLWEWHERPSEGCCILGSLRYHSILADHTDGVNDLAFSPDGQFLVTASQDHTARVWLTGTGLYISVISGHGIGGMVGVAFCPDGRFIAIADENGRAWLCYINGTPQRELHGHRDCIVHLAWANDCSE